LYSACELSTQKKPVQTVRRSLLGMQTKTVPHQADIHPQLGAITMSGQCKWKLGELSRRAACSLG